MVENRPRIHDHRILKGFRQILCVPNLAPSHFQPKRSVPTKASHANAEGPEYVDMHDRSALPPIVIVVAVLIARRWWVQPSRTVDNAKSCIGNRAHGYEVDWTFGLVSKEINRQSLTGDAEEAPEAAPGCMYPS